MHSLFITILSSALLAGSWGHAQDGNSNSFVVSSGDHEYKIVVGDGVQIETEDGQLKSNSLLIENGVLTLRNEKGQNIALLNVGDGVVTKQGDVGLGANTLFKPRAAMGVMLAPVPEVLLAQVPHDLSEAVMITQVQKDYPAAQAGITQHDLLLSVDGNTQSRHQAIQEYLQTKTVGDRVQVRILRKGQIHDYELELKAGKGLNFQWSNKGQSWGNFPQGNWPESMEMGLTSDGNTWLWGRDLQQPNLNQKKLREQIGNRLLETDRALERVQRFRKANEGEAQALLTPMEPKAPVSLESRLESLESKMERLSDLIERLTESR